MLDTNMFSYIVKGTSLAARAEFIRVSENPDARLCISVMTEAEVRFRMAKRALSPARCAAIEALFMHFEILPWGSDEAAVYAAALPKIQAQGAGISLMDFLIGVHAAATNAVLVTHDGDFGRVADLIGIHATVNWATDL